MSIRLRYAALTLLAPSLAAAWQGGGDGPADWNVGRDKIVEPPSTVAASAVLAIAPSGEGSLVVTLDLPGSGDGVVVVRTASPNVFGRGISIGGPAADASWTEYDEDGHVVFAAKSAPAGPPTGQIALHAVTVDRYRVLLALDAVEDHGDRRQLDVDGLALTRSPGEPAPTADDDGEDDVDVNVGYGVHRSSGCDEDWESAGDDTLPFLDPPKDHAVEAANDELEALGALDPPRLTECGRRLFGLPLDAALGRWLVEALEAGTPDDIVDLVAALSTRRPMFRREQPADEDDDLRFAGCDAVALVRAVRIGKPEVHRLDGDALGEARQTARRLRAAFDLSTPARDTPVDRERLAALVLRADPRAAHVARRRGKHVRWSNGGTEIELDARSAAQRGLEDPRARDPVPAIVVLDEHAVADRAAGARHARVIATAAMPVRLSWLHRAGLGRSKLDSVAIVGGRVVARIEQVYARRVLAMDERVPEGALAREAIATLVLRGSVYPGAVDTVRARLTAIARLRQLVRTRLWRGPPVDDAMLNAVGAPVPSVEDWIAARLGQLGVESGDDLELLTADDFTPPSLPAPVASRLEQSFPSRLDIGDARYDIVYDISKREATLVADGKRRKTPPPPACLPCRASASI